MGLTIHDEIEQGTPEWLAARRGLVTASVVGKLITPTLRVADNDVSRGLTATLVAERIAGFAEDTYTNNDMWRGVVSEPIARDLYSGLYQQAEEVGFMLREEPMPWDPNEVARTVDEDAPMWRLGYSPDGVVGTDGLIEIKAPRAKTHLNTILADEVPPFYMPQLQAGLLVSGRDWIDFVSYVGGMPLFVKRVRPSGEWFKAITLAVAQFETTAAEMVAAYQEATKGLAPTERVVEMEMVL